MKIFLQSFDILDRFQRCAPLAAVLLSATCVGNDGKRCPLFHGSLAPELFSRNDPHTQLPDRAPISINLSNLLVLSNTITWAHTVSLSSFDKVTKDIFKNITNSLVNTRYSSRSIKTVHINLLLRYKVRFDPTPTTKFLENHCTALECLTIRARDDFDLSFLQKRSQTLSHLELAMTEQSLLSIPFAELGNLRKLEIVVPFKKVFAQIAKCPALEVLIFSNKCQDWLVHPLHDALKHLKALKYLRELELRAAESISAECLTETLSSFAFLRRLHVAENVVNADTFRQLICPLEEVSCLYDHLDDETIESICEITTLRCVALAASPNVTATGWKCLLSLPLLRTLKLSSKQQEFNILVLEIICSISSLRVLHLHSVAFADSWFESISKLENLEILHCGNDLNYFFGESRINGSGLHHLYKMKSLRKLTLHPSNNFQLYKLAELWQRMQSLTIDVGLYGHSVLVKYFEEAAAGLRRERE
jgi:hypothetical protein